ncbi:MAG: hypothetical protein ACC726_13555 [Chloroflexota bacterium]
MIASTKIGPWSAREQPVFGGHVGSIDERRSIGQEGTATGAALALRRTDWFASTDRANYDVLHELV